MATWRVTYRVPTGIELVRDIAATYMQTVDGAVTFVKVHFAEKGSGQEVLLQLSQQEVVSIDQLDDPSNLSPRRDRRHRLPIPRAAREAAHRVLA